VAAIPCKHAQHTAHYCQQAIRGNEHCAKMDEIDAALGNLAFGQSAEVDSG
jgi:hypothetical protein